MPRSEVAGENPKRLFTIKLLQVYLFTKLCVKQVEQTMKHKRHLTTTILKKTAQYRGVNTKAEKTA